MRKVIILCDRCGAEIRGIPKRFCVKEVRDPTSNSPTIVPVGSKVDGMDFCENCFEAVMDCMFHWRSPQAKEVKDVVTLNEAPVQDPAEKLPAVPEKKDGPAQIYHDEIELYLNQRKTTKWIAEKLNKYGVGYSVALDAVETVKREREDTDGANECPVCHVKPTMILWTEQDLPDQRVFMRRLRCPKCRYTVSEIDGTEKNLIKNWNRYQQLRDEVMKSHEKNEGEK